jgi:peptidoglycan/xylan/chitin deacetylase (PgdA/CDA1 family)
MTFWNLLRNQLIRRSLIVVDRLIGNLYQDRAGILMYHRVTPIAKGQPHPPFNVDPAQFRKQLKGLLALGYTAWPLKRLLRHHQEGLPLPGKVFVVTFDDGYACVHKHAWPILRKLEIPATVFLATRYLCDATPFPFDNWELAGSPAAAQDSWRPLTIEQCREMAADGLIELAAHSHSHKDFRQQPGAFAEDLQHCVQFLAEQYSVANPTFAFPFGYHTSEMIRVVQDARLPCALTVRQRMADRADSPFKWGRFEASQYDNAHTLSVCLNGWYDYISRVRKNTD